MNLRRIVGAIVIILLIFFVINSPSNAADSVQSLGNTLASWANSITSFFDQLV